MKFCVVPDLSERLTGVIARSGSVTPGLSAAIAGSFHLVILPVEDLGDRGGSQLQVA